MDSKEITNKIKESTENAIEQAIKDGIKKENVDYIGKLVDIHKDIANEEYWKNKEENMRYSRNYGNEYGNDYGNYGNEYGNEYGRRRRDSRGRYMARGYDAKYRGDDMLESMSESYHDYSEYKEGNSYGHKQDTIKSLEYMMTSVVDFVEMLKKDAKSPEEVSIIKEYSKQISEL